MLGQAGVPAALIPTVAAGIGRMVANGAKGVPLGIVSFNSDVFASATDVYVTYTSYNKEITLNGLDLSFDYVASSKVSISGTYSWVSDLIFPTVGSSNGLALMLNAPDNKASMAPSVRGREGVPLSINADNIFNHGYRTLPGAPFIGRMVMTRVQYAF